MNQIRLSHAVTVAFDRRPPIGATSTPSIDESKEGQRSSIGPKKWNGSFIPFFFFKLGNNPVNKRRDQNWIGLELGETR